MNGTVNRTKGNTTAQGQIAKANELLAEVAEVNAEFANQTWRELKARWANGTCTFEFVSDKISALIEAKKTALRIQTAPERPNVPTGRYAAGPEDATKFYRVVNKDGRYSLFVYASDEQHLISNWATVLHVLREIEVDPQAAAVRFGKEIGRCYACGRTLTDPVSRELGLGPDCRNKL
jgi:hypothetical protein